MENAPIEAYYIELNLRQNEWLICCTNNLNRSAIDNHLDYLNKSLAIYSSIYYNLIVIDNFVVETANNVISIFCDTFDFVSHIEEPMCYKNPESDLHQPGISKQVSWFLKPICGALRDLVPCA